MQLTSSSDGEAAGLSVGSAWGGLVLLGLESGQPWHLKVLLALILIHIQRITVLPGYLPELGHFHQRATRKITGRSWGIRTHQTVGHTLSNNVRRL